ncbi:MAG: vanadium-dependent haloperoxidase [Verrucomicrobiales bacterium]|nr:vanadium-dependent haloperoxidase [Verrucomicrobiales bacterium]
MSVSRRSFFRLATAAAGGFLGSCAAPMGSNRSYLTGMIMPGEEIPADYYWSDVMFQGVRDQAIGPPLASRIYAMGHLAGFLAVNAIEGRYHNPYSEIGRAPAGINAEAAYAAAVSIAASEALQTPMDLDLMRHLKLLRDGQGDIDAGVRWGKYVGKIVQQKRTIDGGHAEKVNFYFDPSYTPRKTIDSWSQTGPFYKTSIGPRFETYERGLFPNLGNMEPFAIRSKEQFAAKPFIDVRSKEFADQFEEVYRYGGTESSVRTDDQHEIAFFWEDGPRGGTVPAAWLNMGLVIMKKRGTYSLVERAQLLAQMSCAMSDAGLSAWHAKYFHDILRPETAIRYTADQLKNPDPRVRCDPKWTTLIPTPPFPSYVSGHSTFSGAGAQVMRRFLGGDKISITLEALDTVNWPDQLRGAKRHYSDITTLEDENGMSRIYGGVHWQADNIEGLRMGRAIGEHVHQNYLNRI